MIKYKLLKVIKVEVKSFKKFLIGNYIKEFLENYI